MKQSFLVLVLLSTLFACKKKEDMEQVNYTGNQQVSFNNYVDPNGTLGYYKVEVNVANNAYAATGIKIKLTNSTGPAQQDIKVYIRRNDAIVTDYDPSYVPVNAASGAISFDYNTPVIIRKGEREATLPLLINASKLNLASTNALGLIIAQAEGADVDEGEGSKLVVEFGTKNQYDGYYQTKGAAYHPSYGNYVWNSQGVYACGAAFALITSGANSVDLDPGQPLMNAGNLTYFSAVVPRLTVDQATNKVTITSTIASTVFVQYPSYDSRYDPATKTFYIKFGWSSDRVATDTFTFCGPR
jgi:hypothetical protein